MRLSVKELKNQFEIKINGKKEQNQNVFSMR